jgi:peptidyl-prolyl cis-trans isomerase SurA
MNRLFLALSLILSLGARAQQLAPAQPQQQGALVNGIAAIVNEKIITWKDVELSIRDEREFLERRYAAQPTVRDEKIRTLRNERMEELIDHLLVLKEFESFNKPLPESYIDNRINDDIKRGGGRLTFMKTLQSQGLTWESYREKMKERLILELMWRAKVPPDPVISPTKVENYYLANRDKYKVEDQVKLRVIDLGPAPVELAREILKKIDDGASFSEMAQIYSRGAQASQGGDWGWVERKVLREDLAKAAFSLKPRQHSGPIETPTGIYILMVEQVDPAHTRSLTEIRDEIENTLKSDETGRLRKQFVDRLRKKAFIRYF